LAVNLDPAANRIAEQPGHATIAEISPQLSWDYPRYASMRDPGIRKTVVP